jgi:hypothetical protein
LQIIELNQVRDLASSDQQPLRVRGRFNALVNGRRQRPKTIFK